MRYGTRTAGQSVAVLRTESTIAPMRILIQRVTEAQCDISGKTFSQIGGGVVVLVGIGRCRRRHRISGTQARRPAHIRRQRRDNEPFSRPDGRRSDDREPVHIAGIDAQRQPPLVDQGCSRGDIASSVREIRTTCRGAPGQENGICTGSRCGSIRRRHADNAYQRRAGYDMDRLARQRLNEISYIHETY